MKRRAQPAIAVATGRRSRGRPPLDDTGRRRILDATTAVFLEKGFAGAGTSEIARRAHASKQTLYSLFPAKQDLFIAVMMDHAERLFARHVEFAKSPLPPAKALAEIGDMFLGMFCSPEFQSLFRISVGEAQRRPHLAQHLSRVCVERGYSLVAEYLKSRRLGGPAYRRSAQQFISLVLGDFLLNNLLNPDSASSKRALQARVRRAVRDFLRLHSEMPEP